MSFYMAVPALLSVGILGFCAGHFLFKLKQRWCPTCGTTLDCPTCAGAGAHRLPGVRS
jgi:hypothetical protein